MPAFFRSPALRTALVVAFSAALVALLVGTIVWSQYDVRWLAFLGGILVAGLLALASQASRMGWLVMRRSRQLDRVKRLLARETTRAHNAAEAMRMLEARIRLICDAMPSPVLFVDRDGQCRFHNLATERKTGRSADEIDGRPLREILGTAAFAEVALHLDATLAGKPAEYELVWLGREGGDPVYGVRHAPYPPDSAEPLGFYFLTTAAVSVPAGAPPAPEPAAPRSVEQVDGSDLYVKSISQELTGWDDPRASFIQALETSQFLLFAQKIVPLKSSLPDPQSCEILVRLKEEEEKFLPPGNFIPLAEHYGLMEQLDRWVVRALIAWCRQKQKRDRSWRAPLFYVNLSEATVTSRDFPEFVLEELQRSGFAARSLCFEIANPDMVRNNDDARRFVTDISRAGCRIAVDAFGSDKSSFSWLRNLPVNLVKIDGTIIQRMAQDPASLAKLSALNTVCQKLSIRTVAQFVETAETLDKLRAIGVDYAQGYGIARPDRIELVV